MMVKLQGPGMAIDAAGSLARTITFAKTKGRNYAKIYRTPADPKSWPQQAMRAMCDFLGRDWPLVSPGDRATWQEHAAKAQISTFNAFQAFNLARWRDFEPPTMQFPPDGTGTGGGFTWPTCTGVSRGILWSGNVVSVVGNWGMLIAQTTAYGSILRWDGLRHIQTLRIVNPWTWTWRPLPSGPYYFRLAYFNWHGGGWTAGPARQATVP